MVKFSTRRLKCYKDSVTTSLADQVAAKALDTDKRMNILGDPGAVSGGEGKS